MYKGTNRRVCWCALVFCIGCQLLANAVSGVSPLFCNVRFDYDAGDDPRSVAIGDFDGDSIQDLAVANENSGNVSILLGNRDGTFQSATHYGAGESPTSVMTGDFNNDGWRDLTVTNYGSNNVSILLGNGDGTFQSSIDYAAGGEPLSVAIGDFNSDGNQDLAVAYYGNSSVSILLGNGDGTFQSSVDYATGGDPKSVAIGDFNGDGNQDLAATKMFNYNVSILRGNGDGTFQSTLHYGVGKEPVSATIGDFNNDGKQDLAVANSGSFNVSILLNCYTPPPSEKPNIMAGGYWDIPSTSGGILTILSYIYDPDGDINEAEVLYGGAPTGAYLLDDGSRGDFAAGDGMYGFQARLGALSGPVKELLEIQSRDRRRNESYTWPYLTVEPTGSKEPSAVEAAMQNAREGDMGRADFKELLTRIQPNEKQNTLPRHKHKDNRSEMILSVPGIPPFARKNAFTKGPNRPEIKLAGYWDSKITTASGGQFTMIALVQDADGLGDISSVEIYNNGAGTGLFLYDDGQHADGRMGDGVYGFRAHVIPGAPPGHYLLELVATDHSGNASIMWPWLIIDGTSAIKSVPSPTSSLPTHPTPTNTAKLSVTPTPLPTCTPYYSPTPLQRPIIMSGGYFDLPVNGNGKVTVLAHITDPDGPDDITGGVLLLGGQPAGIEITDDGRNGDWTAGDGLYTFSTHLPASTAPGTYLLEIVATDRSGMVSTVWPYLTIQSGTMASQLRDKSADSHQKRKPYNTEQDTQNNMRGSGRTPYKSPLSTPMARGAGRDLGVCSEMVSRFSSLVYGLPSQYGSNPPEIKLAGYRETGITTAQGGELNMLAVAHDADGAGDIASVEVYYQGSGTGVFLDLQTTSGAYAVYSLTATIGSGVPAGRYLLQLVAVDHSGNRSRLWPYLVVEPFTPVPTASVTPTATRTPTPIHSPTITMTPSPSTTQTPYCPWPMFRHDAMHSGRSTFHSGSAPGLKWSYLMGGEIWSSPSIGPGGTIYAYSSNRNLHAFSSSGTFSWSFYVGPDSDSSPAINAGGKVYTGSSEHTFYCLHSDGAIAWSYETGEPYSFSPTLGHGGSLHVGTTDPWGLENHLYRLTSRGALSWSYRVGSGISVSPALDGICSVYTGALDQTFYCLTSRCTLAWSYKTGDVIYSSPAIDQYGNSYTGCDDNRLYAFAPDGLLEWSYETGDDIVSSPAIDAGGRIAIGSTYRDKNLYCLASNGALAWSYTTGNAVRSSPAIDAGDAVYVGSWDNNLYRFGSNSTLTWSCKTGNAVSSSPAIGTDGTIIFGSSDGNVYACNVVPPEPDTTSDRKQTGSSPALPLSTSAHPPRSRTTVVPSSTPLPTPTLTSTPNAAALSLMCGVVRFDYHLGLQPYSIAIGDFDRDGNSDVAVTDFHDNIVSIMLGNNDGTFQPATDYPVGETPYAVVTGDLDSDGCEDMVVANFDYLSRHGDISVLLGTGSGAFLPAVNYPVGEKPCSVALADCNRDGALDIIAANNQSGTVSILLGCGNGDFQTARDYPVGNEPSSVAVGDLNGDGTMDVAIADDDGSLLFGYGDGSFYYGTAYGVSGQATVVGDFDGDGRRDLAVCAGTVAVLLGNGDGTFRGAAWYNAGLAPAAIAVTDIDGDGDDDLIVANWGKLRPYDCGDISILHGNGDGTFQTAVGYGAGNNPWSIAAGDFNRNGKQDLVIASSGVGAFAEGSVTLLLGDGVFEGVRGYGVGSEPVALITADFNGDTVGDCAVANYESEEIAILLGNGNGTFTGVPTVYAGVRPVALAARDFDRDGFQDLAVAHNVSPGTVSIIFGDGTGSFHGFSDYPAGMMPTAMVNADFNGDGNHDLAVCNVYSNDVSILLGTGNGDFAGTRNYTAGYKPVSIAPGDFDGNGSLDLVAASAEGEAVSILLGDGTGAFRLTDQHQLNGYAHAVLVEDMNRDGKQDIGVATSYDHAAAIFLGNGDGSFQPAAYYGLNGFVYKASAIVAEDINGDGLCDLVVAVEGAPDYSYGYASLLLGNGDGTFQRAVDYPVGRGTRAITVGDYNGDNAMDLAGANAESNDLSVLLNCRPAVTPAVTPTPFPSGLPSATATPTVIPTIPVHPCVIAGGYWEIPGMAGGRLTLLAYISDADGLADIDEVEVCYGGVPTGITLCDNGTQDDFSAGDGVYGLSVSPGPVAGPVKELLEVRATDQTGNESVLWPYLTVTSETEKAKVPHHPAVEYSDPPCSMSTCRATTEMEGPCRHGPFPNTFPKQAAPQTGKGQYCPEIKLAGYMDTELTTLQGGQFMMIALVEDADGIDDIATVEIYHGGIGTGVFLLDNGRNGDGLAGDGVYGLTAIIGPGVPAGQYLLELVATDHSGNRSLTWPWLMIQ